MRRINPSRIVVALGGNAITRPGEGGTVAEDYANLRCSLAGVVDLVENGNQVILTHGNGPQVGNQMLRVELARGQAPELPLDIVVADLQGGLGYMIERVLINKLLRRKLEVPVCALLTLVEVDPSDPAFEEPRKFVGPAFEQQQAEALAAKHGWSIREDRGRGWRRVVPSPRPLRIVEEKLIRTLIDTGALVIVTGGGGIPVARTASGTLQGMEAVIDKDLASAVIARQMDAEQLFILSDVERVSLNYGTPQEQQLRMLSAHEARRYLEEGHFPPGSMGPKVEAACLFVEQGGQQALITAISTLGEALEGRSGTWITH